MGTKFEITLGKHVLSADCSANNDDSSDCTLTAIPVKFTVPDDPQEPVFIGETELPPACVKHTGSGSMTIFYEKAECVMPFLGRIDDPQRIRDLDRRATSEATRFSLEEKGVQALVEGKPAFYELARAVANITHVALAEILSMVHIESRFSLAAKSDKCGETLREEGCYVGLGQPTYGTWNRMTKKPEFVSIWRSVYGGKRIPARGQNVFADLLFIAIHARDASQRYDMPLDGKAVETPAVRPSPILARRALHICGPSLAKVAANYFLNRGKRPKGLGGGVEEVLLAYARFVQRTNDGLQELFPLDR